MIDHKELLRKVLKPNLMTKEPVLSTKNVKEKDSAVAIILRRPTLQANDNNMPRYRK